MIFTIIAAITGVSALIGAISGMVTGEGAIAGALHGLAWPVNLVEGGMDLFTGNFTDAGLHILGVSDQVIEDISSGEFASRTYKFGDHLFSPAEMFQATMFGGYEYRNPEEHNIEMGRDFLVGIGTLVLGGLAAKYGTAVKEIFSKGTTFFIAGKMLGDFQNTIKDIGDSIKDLDIGNSDYNLTTVITDLTGVSGSADRFNFDDGDIDVGDLFSTYAEEVEA